MTTVQLVNSDLSTVLLDLNDPTGANNASFGSVRTQWALGGAFSFAAPHEAVRFNTALDGAFTVSSRRGLGEAFFRVLMAATSEANLRLGIGRLANLVTSGGILKIVSGTTRYLRFEPSPLPTAYQGKELELNHVLAQFSAFQGIDVRLACQPYFEGAEVVSPAATVPNDPATLSKVRVYPVTISGDLPTPAKVQVKMDSGATVTRILMAHRAQGSKASSYFADYLSDTGFTQCEAPSGRGWTITFGTDTSAALESTASPGSGNTIAQCSYSSTTSMARRVRATRTTKVASLVGEWDVWLRCRIGLLAAKHVLELHWDTSTADPAVITEPAVELESQGSGANPFVELKLGTISIPDGLPLGGFVMEVWASRSGAASNLDMDLLWLTPAEKHTTVTLASGSTTTWRFTDFVTPSGITGDPQWSAGSDSSSSKVLNATNEATGTPPASGLDPVDGRHEVTFTVSGSNFGGTFKLRITNETDNVEVAASSLTIVNFVAPFKRTLSFDAEAGKNYLYGVYLTSFISGKLEVNTIEDKVLPVLAVDESARTDPGPRYAVDRLDVSGNLSGVLGVEGEVPAMLLPGPNHIMVRCDETQLSHFVQKMWKNDLARTPTVSVTYSPRYAL